MVHSSMRLRRTAQLIFKRTSDPRQDLRRLTHEYLKALTSQSFARAEQVLELQRGIVASDLADSTEEKDWVTLIDARRQYLEFRKHRDDTGIDKTRSLSMIVQTGIPAPCVDRLCSFGPPNEACLQHHATLNDTQKQTCLLRLDAQVEDQTILAGAQARLGLTVFAARARRAAASLHRVICALEPTVSRDRSQSYLDYWANVSSSHVALARGGFKRARRHLRLAYQCAKHLNVATCFPNYFRDPVELRAHVYVVNGLQRFAQGKFAAARKSLKRWLAANRVDPPRIRHDNIQIQILVFGILEELQRGTTLAHHRWVELESLADRSYVSEQTRALLNHVTRLRAAAFARNQAPDVGDLVFATQWVAEIRSRWRLLSLDIPVRPKDQGQHLTARPFRRPSYLLLSHLPAVHRSKDFAALKCDIRHHLLLAIDWVAAMGRGGDRVEVGLTDRASLHELASQLDRAAGREIALAQIQLFHAAEAGGDYVGAAGATEGLLQATKYLTPHCIQAQSTQLDQTEVRRLSVDTPASMTVAGFGPLEAGEYYYLYPTWNTRLAERYNARNERAIHAELPKYLDTFQQGWSRGLVNAPHFREWISQFAPHEVLLATKLFSGLRFFDYATIRHAWSEISRTLHGTIDPKSTFCLFGLGHSAKSGRLATYSFRQAVSQLENEGTLDLRDKRIFRDISAAGEDPPEVAIFLDDFIGTGKQSRRLLESYLDEHPWLRPAKRYLCAVTGFGSGADDMTQSPGRLLDGVLLGVRLDERARAFSPENPLWRSVREATAALEWASAVGSELLSTSDHGLDAVRDALGFEGTQAMVVFPYNIPNNSLPLFWARGVRNGKPWQPLYERFD